MKLDGNFDSLDRVAHDAFHLSTRAAEIYETQKIPFVFGPLAEATIKAIELPEDGHILDVACGTGIVPRTLAKHLTGKGQIVGTDLNPAMVTVAQRLMPECKHQVKWYSCDVVDLPFEDEEFDLVFCQQGLQFFPDKAGAVAEIYRVIKPGGIFAPACWCKISPLFQAVSDSLKKRVSDKSAFQALVPFSFREREVISSLLTAAGFKMIKTTSLQLQRPLQPPREAIRREILASPYEQELMDKGEETIEGVINDVELALAPYRQGENLLVPQESNLFIVEKPK